MKTKKRPKVSINKISLLYILIAQSNKYIYNFKFKIIKKNARKN